MKNEKSVPILRIRIRTAAAFLILGILPYLISIHDLSYIYNIPMKMNPVPKMVIFHKHVNKGHDVNYLTSDTASGKFKHYYFTCMECYNLLSLIFMLLLLHIPFVRARRLLPLLVENCPVADIFHPPSLVAYSYNFSQYNYI